MNVTVQRDELKLWVFLSLILVGPALSLSLLKAHLLAVFFVILVMVATALKNRVADKRMLAVFTLIVSCCLFWFLLHALSGAVNTRYFVYLFYTIFCFMVFVASFYALTRLRASALSDVLFVVCCINLIIAYAELVMGISLFGLNPVGDLFQIGSSFWANVNTNAYAVLIFSSAMYLLGAFKRYLIITIMLLVYCVFIQAKLILAFTMLQFIFFIMYSNPRYRVYGFLTLALFTPLFTYFFYGNIFSIFLAVEYAAALITDEHALKELVETGRLSSVVIRAYTLSEMIATIQDFELWHFLFGQGFGTINISFMNNTLGVYETHYSPHFFFLEIFIYAGVLFYALYLISIRLLAGSFGMRYFFLLSPAFAAVIAVSSAVYFPPFYFLLALVAFLTKKRTLLKRTVYENPSPR